MAVKKYRPGQLVDLGYGGEQESPLDKLIKLMQVGQGVGASIQSVWDRQDRESLRDYDRQKKKYDRIT